VATTTDIRAWAKTQGIEVKAKGPVPDDVAARYAEAHAGGQGAAADYPGEEPVTAAVAAAAPPPADPRQAERIPKQPKPTAAGKATGGLFARIRGGGKAPGKARPAGKRLPRVSLANLIEDAWGQMAWAATSIPPMQKLLQAQAPFAGIALEDALAGTVVDRALQPIARAEDKAKAVGGLLFPPMALMLALATAPLPQEIEGTDPPQYMYPEPDTQHKAALMTLRWSLMLWSEAGAARLEEYRARADANAERGAQADAFMAWILGYEDAPGQDPERAAASLEDEAVARAQAMFGQ
jgi:hypothetical protein